VTVRTVILHNTEKYLNMDCRLGRSRGTTLWKMIGLAGLMLASVMLGPALGDSAVVRAHEPAAAVPLVFDRVTVVDVEHGRLLREQRVVIVGNRIHTMGSVRTVRIPAGARVVDARGKYLIPGLWDMHTHSEHSTDLFYPLFLANGVTGIRDAGSPVPLDTLLMLRREILAGTRVGPPRQLLSGPAIDEGSPCGRGQEEEHICVADSADARHVVDSLKAAGADIIKTYDLKPDMYFVIAAEARRIGIRFGGHTFRATTAIGASDSGASILDHLNASGGLNSFCLGESPNLELCQRVAERFRRNGTWLVPTLVAIAFLKNVYLPERPILNRSHKSLAGDTVVMRWYEFIHQFWTDSTLHLDLRHGPIGAPIARELHPISPTDTVSGGILKLMRSFGMPILAGTDVIGPEGFEGELANAFEDSRGMPPGFALHTELALYVAEGLTPLEALQTATLNPAKLLHGTDSLGTVASGKLADLILLDANPLDDITNTTTIRAVVANGRYFDRAALDQLIVDAQTKSKHVTQKP
jgi:hypothetical protein